MPELPEVETVARDLRQAGLVGRRITGVSVAWERTIDRPALNAFAARLQDQQVTAVSRRAKYLILHLSSGDALLIHLRMTGHLDIVPAATEVPTHTRVIFDLDDGTQLRFRDTRKFGRLYLVSDPREVLGKLGPEPIDQDFTAADLQALLAHRQRQIKPLLLDQTIIAGLGNIYVDEALWQARIHPERLAATLGPAEIEALWQAMRAVLNQAIGNEGTTFSTYASLGGKPGQNQTTLKAYARTGQPCYECGTPIVRLIIGQRSTHICPHCQPAQA
jgi:formamidopyrimidine-DNA glycosylase